MTRIGRIGWHLSVMAVLVALGGALSAADKQFREKPRKGQVGLDFVNRESEDAHGLVVNLSRKAIVVTDTATGFAGPFQNIRGSGTKTIELSNARPPVVPAHGEGGGFNLVFRSYKQGLKIKSYYWTDVQGKRIGKKISP